MRTRFILIIILAILIGSLGACNPQPTDEIQVWLTLSDGSRKLAHQNSLSFDPQAGNPDFTINIDPSLLYQPVDGFGAAITDSSAWLNLGTTRCRSAGNLA